MCVLGCLLLVTMSMAAISVGVDVAKRGEGWTVVGPAAGYQKTPILIEWDGSTAVIHRDGGKVAVKWSKPSGFLVRTPFGRQQAFGRRRGTRLDFGWGHYPASDKEFHKQLKELEGLRQRTTRCSPCDPPASRRLIASPTNSAGRKIDIGYEPIRQERPVRLLLPGD